MQAALTRAPSDCRRLGDGFRPLLAAMIQTGGGAAASGLASAGAAKIIAVVAGSPALALLATLQQIRQAALVAATANGQTALVRGASSLEGPARREYVRTAGWLFAGSTLAVTAGLAIFARPLARWAGIGEPGLARGLAFPVALSAAFVFMSGLLNAHGAIGRLAGLQVLASVALAAGAWPAARWAAEGRSESLVWLIGFSAGLAALAAAWMLRSVRADLAGWFRGAGRWWSRDAAGGFFAMSGALLVTGLAATCSLLAVRGRIISDEGLAATGRFDAAWAVSMSQATLVLGSLQTWYLPALARERSAEDRSRQISRVLAAAAPLSAALICALALLKRPVLGVLYSPAFHPAARYLRWTLLGDYLKVTSWVLSVPLIALAEMKAFLLADLSAYATFLAAATILVRGRGAAESAAVAFLLMYAVHLAICAVWIARRHRFRPSRAAAYAWVGGLLAVAAISAMSWDWS